MDLAEGHVAALRYMDAPNGQVPTPIAPSPIVTGGRGFGKYSVFNLGTGRGYSVLEMIEGIITESLTQIGASHFTIYYLSVYVCVCISAMKVASGRPLPFEFGNRSL
jgi:hypothetical protein